jgi:hypothetical protein
MEVHTGILVVLCLGKLTATYCSPERGGGGREGGKNALQLITIYSLVTLESCDVTLGVSLLFSSSLKTLREKESLTFLSLFSIPGCPRPAVGADCSQRPAGGSGSKLRGNGCAQAEIQRAVGRVLLPHGGAAAPLTRPRHRHPSSLTSGTLNSLFLMCFILCCGTGLDPYSDLGQWKGQNGPPTQKVKLSCFKSWMFSLQ